MLYVQYNISITVRLKMKLLYCRFRTAQLESHIQFGFRLMGELNAFLFRPSPGALGSRERPVAYMN
jgi:hypothetical protein